MKSLRIIFMGTPEFAVPSLQTLLTAGFSVVGVVCQPDRPQGRHGLRKPPPVKVAAMARQIPVLQPEKVRTEAFEKQLAALRPDLVVTAAYGRILPKNILDLPRYGCINVHASLLPAYRGAAPIQWSLIHGETISGVTIMLMDEGMDTGDILSQASIPVSEDMDAGRLSEQLARLGADLLPGVIADYVSGRIRPEPQDHGQASLAPIMKREDGQIDWEQSAAQIHNRIRGTYPWPGAYTWCDDKRLKVHRARVCQDEELIEQARELEPGTICLCGDEFMSVTCGSGVIDLLEIQSESGRRMHCRDCAHNYRFGQRMGGDPS